MFNLLPTELLVVLAECCASLTDLHNFAIHSKSNDHYQNCTYHLGSYSTLTSPNVEQNFWKPKVIAKWPKAIKSDSQTWREYLYKRSKEDPDLYAVLVCPAYL